MPPVGNLNASLAAHARQLLEDNWAAAEAVTAGGSSFTVQTQTSGAAPYVGASRIALFIGASLTFTSGKSDGFQTTITALTSAVSGSTVTTTVTIADGILASVAAGDAFAVFCPPPGSPANVSQVTAAYSVGASATAIGSNPSGRKWILVFNNGSGAIYVGGSAVTTSDGIPVPAGGSASFPVGPGTSLYAISTATQDVRTMEAQ